MKQNIRAQSGVHLAEHSHTGKQGVSHISVLLNEVLETLDPRPGDVYVDMTVNGGGHSLAVSPFLKEDGVIIGIDADPNAIARAKRNLSGVAPSLHLVTDNFRNIKAICHELGVKKVNKVLFDLGLSSNELETSGRGFTFQKDEPLLMTFSPDTSKVDFTAADILNTWDEENIATILTSYGEERFARRIAHKIVDARSMKKFETTGELVDCIKSAVPQWYRVGRKTHFATKTFQALRMAVNDELRTIETGLSDIWPLLAPKGRIAVISFHSKEDRVVKQFMKEKVQSGEGAFINKKPIVPTEEETTMNRRARSAKLRVIEKIQL